MFTIRNLADQRFKASPKGRKQNVLKLAYICLQFKDIPAALDLVVFSNSWGFSTAKWVFKLVKPPLNRPTAMSLPRICGIRSIALCYRVVGCVSYDPSAGER